MSNSTQASGETTAISDLSGSRPNIVVVVFDDTGYSDFGCFGSEIETPTIDRLAADGGQYTNFHVSPLCSPTHASLLTGRNPHRVGMGWLADLDLGTPGRRGRVDPNAAMLPRHLRDAGYMSYLLGKWHLTPQSQVVPGGPFEHWPLAKGFDRFYGFLEGCTDQFAPELVEDNHVLDAVDRPGYHLTTDLIDRGLRYLADHRTYNGDRPFYLQLAFGATHAPFQAPRSYIEPYLEVFEKGWDQTRTDRLERQKRLGIMPAGAELAPRPAEVPAWDTLTDDEQRVAVALQAAFAGFLSHTDHELGRFLAGLADLGVADDTIVIVISDNGAAHDGGRSGSADVLSVWNGLDLGVEYSLGRLEQVIESGDRSQYPEGWAMAGNTPLPRYKQFVDAGGVRAPLIVHYPPVASGIRNQFTHVIDVMPTLLELAGVTPAQLVDGREQLPIDGRSFTSSLIEADAPPHRDTQYFEMAGVRALWHDGWKAIASHTPGADLSDDTWQLYHVDVDPSEHHDLAELHPDRLDGMIDRFEQAAIENSVYPVDDRSLKELLASADPVDSDTMKLWPVGSHTSSHTYLAGSRRHGRLITTIDTSNGWQNGPLVASGTTGSGYRLSIDHGEVLFEHQFMSESVEVRRPLPEPTGDATITVSITGAADSVARTFVVAVNGIDVGSATAPYTARRLNFWGLDVGCDQGWSRQPAHPGLKHVVLELHDHAGEAADVLGVE